MTVTLPESVCLGVPKEIWEQQQSYQGMELCSLQNIVMEFKNIHKSFGENLVFDNIDLKLIGGKAHCIVGFNGSGKSTLAKIASGERTLDSGEIFFEGRQYTPWTTKQAVSLGVVMVSEYSGLFQSQTVYQNMQYSLIRQRQSIPFPIISQKKEIMRQIQTFIKKYGFQFTPKTQVGDLINPEKIIIELLRAMLLHVKVLIVDEIDIAMDRKYKEIIKEIILDMKQSGTSILYISHKLDMVMSIADTIGIMQYSQMIEVEKDNINEEKDILEILFNCSAERVPKLNKRRGIELLKVEYREHKKDVFFQLYEGEILGLTGLGKNDSALIYNLLFNKSRKNVNIYLNGKRNNDLEPQTALQSGVVFISSEFMQLTTFSGYSVCSNMLPYNVVCKVRDLKKQNELCQRYINILGIRAKPSDLIDTLSLGNQRKVFIARSFLSRGDIYIFENPTDSIDGVSKIDIYNIINELKVQGKGTIVISNDLKEIMGISDRILLLQDGNMMGQFENDKQTQNKIKKSFEEIGE